MDFTLLLISFFFGGSILLGHEFINFLNCIRYSVNYKGIHRFLTAFPDLFWIKIYSQGMLEILGKFGEQIA